MIKKFLAGAAALAFSAAAYAITPAEYVPSTMNVSNMTPVTNPSGYHMIGNQQSGGIAAYGDTYGLELLAQNTTNAFYITTVGGSTARALGPDTTYDGVNQSMGDDAIYVPPAGVQSSELETTDIYGRVHLTIQIASVGGFDLLPAGVDPDGAGPQTVLTALRMDMGRTAAGANQLAPLPLFDIILARVVLYAGGNAILTSNITASATNSGAGQLAQTGLKDLVTIGGAAGVGINAMQFQYIIGTIPEPTTLGLLALGALAMYRRR